MEATVTKRLHVSGLTPAISKDDLANRLSTFGSVKALDGFGLVDGVGRPRKFAYVTLEATPAKLARCLNLLSGSTWKGTKLRIGEAKPNFADRIATENKKSLTETVRMKRRLRYGRYTAVHAKDMSLVTPESASHKGGWNVTPMGRIYHPIRTRPVHPLPPPPSSNRVQQNKLKEKLKERRKAKRIKQPDMRARRKKIDMTKWGSVYLKGKFLDTDVPMLDIEYEHLEETPRVESVDESESEDEETETIDAVKNSVAKSLNVPALTQTASGKSALSSIIAAPSSPLDVQSNLFQEKQQSLNLLASLFNGDNELDWMGKESVGSDVEEAYRINQPPPANNLSEEEFEQVPLDRPSIINKHTINTQAEDNHAKSSASELPRVTAATTNDLPTSQRPQAEQPQTTKLKDLFAPREREGSFSLLGHLDLDLELDEDIPFTITETEQQPLEELDAVTTSTSVIVPSTSITMNSTQNNQQSVIKLDPDQPLFFPLSMLGIDKSTTKNVKGKQQPRDLFDVAKERKVHWRDPEVGFWRTETEDEIRKKWEERKVELTRDWKKRWREAAKIRRRRGRGGDGDGDV